jgi:hypothetical protein
MQYDSLLKELLGYISERRFFTQFIFNAKSIFEYFFFQIFSHILDNHLEDKKQKVNAEQLFKQRKQKPK